MQTMHKKHMCPWLLPGLLGLARCAPVPHTYAAIIEAGFYPEGTDLQLVLKIIETARQEIRLMDYSFTSWEVVRFEHSVSTNSPCQSDRQRRPPHRGGRVRIADRTRRNLHSDL